MAEVVMIHGAFHELWGPFRLWTRWTPSLLDGLWAAGVPAGGVDLERIQRMSAVAFWGDLVRPEPRRPDETAPDETAHGDCTPDETAHGDSTHAGASGSSGPGTEDVTEELGDGAMLQTGDADLDRLVAQVAANANRRSMELLACYVTDPEMRTAVHERFERHLSPDTRVVIAHSLGSVIAYQVLCTRPDLSVDLITLGSPLGGPMVFDLLEPTSVDGVGVWPAGVRHWTNVAAEGDLATAAAPRLAAKFGDRVSDHFVYNGRHAHDVEPYLNSSATGAALATALGLEHR